MAERDRGRAPRVERRLFVHYRPTQTASPAWGYSQIKDFSLEGLAFMGDQPFEEGTELEMRLASPLLPFRPVVLHGRVQWSRPVVEGIRYDNGVAFTRVDEASRVVIERSFEIFHARQVRRDKRA